MTLRPGSLRMAFMGSPAFAVPAMRALHQAGHEIAAVYSQPPRPSGRGFTVTPCPVHAAALTLGLAVRTPARLRQDISEHAAFAALNLDVAVVAAYGLILPPPMLAAPTRGCLNIHASLLPRWRGAAPIQAAVLAGDAETGITIMQMDAGLDTGAMLRQGRVPIGPRATAAELHDTLAALGADLVLQVLNDSPTPEPQPSEGITYAAKLTRDSGRLDWAQPAVQLDRQVRALTPWPGTWMMLGAEVLKVLRAEPAAASGVPGTVLDTGLLVACGRGALRLLRVQRPGRAPMEAEALLRGFAIPPGTRLA
jgi:methionyl-tRNA formyltransferase